MPKYKIGDNVRIIKDLKSNKTYDNWAVVNDTVREGVSDLLAKGIADNLSNAQMGKLLSQDPSGLFSRARAMRIARTETTTALNGGHWSFAKT